MKGYILSSKYVLQGEDEEPVIQLFGRLNNGKSFLIKQNSRPYFFIKTSDEEKAKELINLDYEPSDYTNFDKEKLTRVYTRIPTDISKAKSIFLDEQILCFESDVNFSQKFLIEKDLKGTINIEGEELTPSEEEFVDVVFENPELTKEIKEDLPELKVLAFDIETSMDLKQLLSISLAIDDYSICLITKEGKFNNAESYKTEKEVLERFKEIIQEKDPDIITGWNCIDFDFKVLKDKFAEHDLKFDIGRTTNPIRLRLEESFYRTSKADGQGRIIVDGLDLVKSSYIKLPDYKLNTAATVILKDSKLLTGADRGNEIQFNYINNPQLLIDYNIKDSTLVLGILEKCGALDLAIEKSVLTRMPIDRVNSSIASFDSLYLCELHKKKLIATSSYGGEREERIIGGFVKSSIPGLYDNILVLDFKSLYPSMIKTFNIDPYSFEGVSEDEVDKTKFVKAPNNAVFRNDTGILGNLLLDLWTKRDDAKKRKNKPASQAIKTIMNSFFGVLANPTCRFYNRDIANSITHYGQKLIQLCAEKVEEKGFKVIYGDTDSIFIDSATKDYDKAVILGEKLAEEINSFFQEYVKKEYSRDSILEIEFEKNFKKFFMPRHRNSEEGAKKRYAGILIDKNGKEEIDFTGLEFVRSDWTQVAKTFQLTLFDLMFHDKPLEEYIKKFIEELKSGKHDDLLVYTKSIRKAVEEYTKTTPPHIKAARKAGMTGIGLIKYVVTTDGPEEIDHKKHHVDYDHYIDKQLKPIAETVLQVYDKTFDEVIEGVKQKGLGSFF